MKLFRFGLNAWMTLVSLASFLLGWVVLAHAPKPVQPTQASVTFSAQILPELSPVPNWGFGSDEVGISTVHAIGSHAEQCGHQCRSSGRGGS